MPYPNESRVHRIGINVLSKAPIPGLAKTRLIPRLGAEGAAGLQRWLLQRTMTTAFSADTGPVSLWCAPDERHPDFATCRAYGPVTLKTQPAGDLGQRMFHALQASTDLHGALVIGTDCAVLTPTLVRSAAHALLTHDAVVIPAEDGGYVLIGMRKPEARVFENMAWSTSTVMAETRNRFAALGGSVKELPTLWDIDVPDDVDRLCALCPQLVEGLTTSGGRTDGVALL